MPDPSSLRDSTEIIVPCEALSGLREGLQAEYTVTVHTADGEFCRIIGSPVEIKGASEYLARHGVTLP